MNLDEIGRRFGGAPEPGSAAEITRALGKISEDPDFAEVEDHLR